MENNIKSTGTDSSKHEVDFVLHIQTEFDSMPKAYKKIANYVINNPESLYNMSITRLAQKIGTCTSTITRFCQSLGFSGYPQFKFNAEKNLMLSISGWENIERGDSVTTIKQKLLPRYLQSIEETLKLLTPSTLEQISNIMASAGKICFFGHGGSGASALTGQILFMQIGLPAVAYIDISMSSMAAAQLRRGDVAIGITSSGLAKTPIDALRVAKSKGATTIGITGFTNSQIADYSDILICFNLGIEDIRLMHIGRLCEATILGVLQNCILSKNYDTMNRNLQLAKDAFMGARYV